MPPATPSLGDLQRWMLQVISHPGSIEEGVHDPRATALIPDPGELVRGPGPLDAKGGVGIYHRMYKLRLREALEIDYPALEWALGSPRFVALADRYIAAHPSSSWTLNRLGDRWPAFLAKTEDPWIGDLARLELEQTLAIQSPDSGRLLPEALGAVSPEAFEAVILVPAPSLRLFEADHDVVKLFEAYQEDAPFTVPEKAPTRVAVHRLEGTEQLTLAERPYRLLKALSARTPLGEAIAMSYPDADDAAALELQQSLADWVGRGLFSAIAR